jgi:hypothetical protein
MNGQRQPRARVMFTLDFFGRRLANIGAGHRVVTKLWPLLKVKLLNNQADRLVVRSLKRLASGL